MEELIRLKVDEIAPNPRRPRASLPHESLLKLADSIRQSGILQPLLVAHTPVGYQIVSGERRWRAAKLAGLEEVPVVIVKDLQAEEMILLNLVENIHREDLTVFEQGAAIERLRNEFGRDLREIAERLGVKVPELQKRLQLLNFSDKVKEEILARNLTDREALALTEHETEKEAYQEVIKKSKYSM